MREQEVRGLQEAYMQVYELDEGKKKFPTDKVNKQAVKHEKDYLKNPNSSGSSLFKSRKMRAIKSTVDAGSDPRKTIHGQDLRKLGTKNEELDIYDIILSHLLDEGYADTEQAAEAIMVNMGEEWREDIVEGMTMKDFKANRRKLQRKEASDDAKKRGHVDKFTGKPYGTEEAASRRKDIHSPSKAPEREARRKFAEDPD